jgi:hypothetical protein
MTGVLHAKNKGAQNIFYIDSYVKSNLGDSKTTSLIKLREQIEDSLKKPSTEEIDKANSALQAYLKENDLVNSYGLIVRNFTNAPTSPAEPKSLRERLGVGPKSPFLIDGPADDIILLYNSSPSAPDVWKNVRGDILFQNGAAALCFSQTNPDAALGRYVERLLNQQGANKVTRGPARASYRTSAMMNPARMWEDVIFSCRQIARLVGRRARIDSARLDTDRRHAPGQTTDAVSNPTG